MIRKLRKMMRSPHIFFRDYLLKKYPLVLNEIGCSINEEDAVAKHLNSLSLCLENDLRIDIVFTWVDESDPVWRKKLDLARSKASKEKLGKHATDNARFKNHNELYYSIRAVRKFLPWANNIFVVTDNQHPDWLNEVPNTYIIDHADIIPPEYLPTFNSHVIEAYLHRISNLSEHFIYFNDDVFVARPIAKGHFFQSNGLPSLFLSRKDLDEQSSRGRPTPTLSASLYCAALLERDFGVRPTTPLIHSYIPLTRSGYEMVWKKYEVEILQFLPNCFRGKRDMNLASFLVPWANYLGGKAVPSLEISYYFNAQSAAAPMYWEYIKGSEKRDAPLSFCANDFRDQDQAQNKKSLPEELMEYYKELNKQ